MALMPMIGRAAHAAQLGRHHGHVHGRLADHRPHADRRASISTPAGATAASRRRPASGWCFAHLIATRRAASARRRLPARPLRAPAHVIDEKGQGAAAQPALRRSASMRIPCPYLRRARRHASSPITATRRRAPRSRRARRRGALLRLRLSARQPGRAACASIWYHAQRLPLLADRRRATRARHEIAAARVARRRGGARR